MTNKDVVKQLRARNIKVKYYTRKDGSIRITQVGARRFNQNESKGNLYARALVGNNYTDEALAQRRRISYNVKFSREEKATLKRFYNELRKVNKERLNKDKDYKPLHVSYRTFYYAQQKEGLKEALNQLRNSILHKAGIAYQGTAESAREMLTERITERGFMPEDFGEPGNVIDKNLTPLTWRFWEVKNEIDEILTEIESGNRLAYDSAVQYLREVMYNKQNSDGTETIKSPSEVLSDLEKALQLLKQTPDIVPNV